MRAELPSRLTASLLVAGLAVAGFAVVAPAAAQEACAQVPSMNDRCPEWTAVFDNPTTGPVISVDRAAAMAASPDGSRIFLAGETTADDTGGDMTTIAYDGSGTRLWTARHHAPALGTEIATDLAVSPDGSAVLTVGAEDVMEDGDSRAVVAAYEVATGQEAWVAIHDGEAPGNDGARAVAISPDGKTAFVAISSRGPGGDTDLLTVAYDVGTGDELWSDRYAGMAGLGDGPADLALSPDGSRLYVTGTEGTSEGASVYLSLAYDVSEAEPPAGPLWVATYDGPGPGPDAAAAIGLSDDGDTVFVTGTSDGGPTLLDWATGAYDAATGEERWVARSASEGEDRAAGLAVAGDRVVVTGRQIGDVVEGEVFVRAPTAVTIGYAADDGAEVWEHSRATPAHSGEESLAVAASPDGSRVYVTYQSGVFTFGSYGGCSSEDSFECRSAADPGTVILNALASEDGRETWTARAPGTGNIYRPSAVPVAAAGSRVYMAASYAYPFAVNETGAQQAGNLADLWTMAYRVPDVAPRNVTCAIHPRDADLSHMGGGFGTPQVRADALLVHASDNGSFLAECDSRQGDPFEITVRYHFEVSPTPGEWDTLGPGFACTATSVGREQGQTHTAVVNVPGTRQCEEAEIIFPENDPSLGLPHRLCVRVLEVSGCTESWTHEKVG